MNRTGGIRISSPLWLWLAYGAVIVTLGVLTGSFQGFALVYFSAAFSFQFWTFATHRGMTRAHIEESA